MGRGNYGKASVTYGQRARGFDLSFVEPFLFGYRMAGGIDLFGRQNLASNYVSYDSQTIGANLRLGFALTEEIAFQPRYSIYQQKITLPVQYNNCQFSSNAPGNGPDARRQSGKRRRPIQTGVNSSILPFGCYSDGEASLAVRKELAQGPVHGVTGGVYRFVQYARQQQTSDQRSLRRTTSRISQASAAT